MAVALLSFTVVCGIWIKFTSAYNLSVTYVTYTETNPNDSSIDVTEDEISGLVWFRNTPSSSDNDGNVFYGISDDLESDKGWVKYAYNSSMRSYQMTAIGGTLLGDNPEGANDNTDSESIAILGLPFESGYYDDSTDNTPTNELRNDLYGYFVIGTEGHRSYDTLDHIMLFDMNGTYIKDFDFPDVYNITNNSGNEDNGGFEGLDISGDYKYITFVNERALVQEECDICRRISVGRLNSDTAGSLEELNVTYEYMLRYDTSGTDWWITDMIFLNASKFVGDDAPSMPALILEGARDVYPPAYYNIFLVDLALGDNDDVSNCWSLGDSSYNCTNTTAIDKYDVFNFSCKLPPSIEALVEYVNFEAIAVYDDPDNDDDCHQTLIAVNDNGNIGSNYFITYQMDYCDSDEDKSCQTEYPSPQPTSSPIVATDIATTDIATTDITTTDITTTDITFDSDSVESMKISVGKFVAVLMLLFTMYN